MEVKLETLDRWPRVCERLRSVLVEVLRLLAVDRADEALELVEFAYITVLMLGNDMHEAGAARAKRMSVPPDVPLNLLCSEANWRFARTLRQAYEAGRQVDNERGWDEEGPATILQMLLADVEMQVYGVCGVR
jgi:hypothetical protein